LNGKGFITHCQGEIKEIAARIEALFKTGFLSSQKRFELGWTHIKGDSPDMDLKNNSADGVFFRLVSESSVSKSIIQGNVSGDIQIFAKLKAVEWLPYFYHEDKYGTRLRGNAYKDRPNLEAFFSRQQASWNATNEVIFKNRLDPRYLCAITYQDPRKVIVKAIEELGNRHLFAGCSTAEEKADRLSRLYFSNDAEEKQRVLDALKGPNFDGQKEIYPDGKSQKIEKKLATHWMIDPKIAIQESLQAAGMQASKILIVETDTFTSEVLQACHQPLHQKVRKLALKPHVSTQIDNPVRDDGPELIEAIRARLKTLSKEQLSLYINDEVLKSIGELKKKCQKNLSNIGYCGQDSLNRELLTQYWNNRLHDPKVIIGLYALEEIQRKESGQNGEKNPLSEHLIFKAQKKTKVYLERKLSECLYFGWLNHHPVLLALTSKQGRLKYLREYLRRTKINLTFLPVLKAIESAYEILLKQKPSPLSLKPSLFNQPYDPKKWKKEYLEIFHKVMEFVDNKDERELLKLIANQFSPSALKHQVETGFRILLECEAKSANEMTLDEIVKYITECDYLLDHRINHMFYDRLHLLAALKSDAVHSIQTKTGSVSLRDLMKAIIQSFEKGVNEENAIAAEQFYLRIIQIYEKLKD
jgi:hypothetical protein